MMSLKKEIKIFFTALSFYTRIPCYHLGDYSPECMNKSAKYCSLIGWIVGGIAFGVYYAAKFLFPYSICILISMISTILLTGAFHEDGFADFLDGFGGGSTKEQILTIMKDSRVGTYGVIGLISILAIKYLCLLSMKPSTLLLILIAGHSLSRFISTTYMYTHKYVSLNDSKSSGICQKGSTNDFVLSAVFAIIPFIFLNRIYFLVLIPILLIRELYGFYLSKKIGGYTGDCLGSIQQITEVAFYLLILAGIWKYI